MTQNQAHAELLEAVGDLRALLDRTRHGLSSVTASVLLAEQLPRLERVVKLLEPEPMADEVIAFVRRAEKISDDLYADIERGVAATIDRLKVEGQK